MRFLYPEFLYLMLIPAALLIYLISTNKDSLERVFDPITLKRLRIGGDSLGRGGHNLLAFLVFSFMTLALAEPVIERGERVIKSSEVDLVIALDLSKSMMATDFYPDRLTFAKQKLEEILPQLPARRIGVIGFTSAAFIVAPLTEDRESIEFLLKRVKPQTVSVEGTDIATAIKGAMMLLRRSDEKRVLLVTDGGDERDLKNLKKLLKKGGVKPIVWMVATERGAPIVLKDGRLLKERSGKVVVSRANTALRKLAEESGGFYTQATISQEDEKRILSHLKRLSSSAQKRQKVLHDRIELFYYPLILAFLIMPFALYSFGRRGSVATILLASLPLFLVAERAEAGIMDFTLIKDGEKAYVEGDYNKSAKLFEKLSESLPRNEVWFDLAGSYYKSGHYMKALKTYEKIVTSDRELNMAKLYSMANCYVKLGDLQKGIELYKKVLEMGEDDDAKANLELVTRLLREQQKERKKSAQEEENESRKQKESGLGKEESVKSGKKSGNKKGRAKPREISEAEEKKWMCLIQNQPLKSKLYPLISPEEDRSVNPW